MTRARCGARVAALAAVLLLAADAPAHVLFDRVSLRQWIAESDAVVVADFPSDVQMWRAPDGSDRQEFFEVRVVEVLAGDVAPGGLAFFPHAEGFPSFRAGDRALLFLEHTARDRAFAGLAERFPCFSAQGAGQEWKLGASDDAAAVLEVARRVAGHRARPPADARAALREILQAELASGSPRLRRDAIAELVRARGWPGFLDAESTPAFAAWVDAPLPASERLALVRLLDGAPGFDADARLLAMTREPLAERELAQLVRSAGPRSDTRLRAWLATLANDERAAVQREARAALATPH